jgi:repressor LexA
LNTIVAQQESLGRSPTVREIAQALGVGSTATVHQHLRVLEAKGYLARLRYRHRALRPLSPPHRPAAPAAPDRVEMTRTPLLGLIAAGRPIDAIETVDDDAYVDVPSSYLAAGEHFALRVVGESMIDDGILDGDLILVRRQDRADAGQTVVALIDGEATVKKLYFRGAEAELRPANATMQSFYVPRDRLVIQGVVVSLVRRYR